MRSENKKSEQAYYIWMVLLTLLALALRGFELSSQPLSDDDIAVAVSSWNYMERGHLGPVMWNHPPLRNILVYLSLLTFGSGPGALKFVSLILGTLSIPAAGIVAKRLLRRTDMAVLAAFFLCIDPLHIDYSRQAVHEVYMMFFFLFGIYLALKYMDGSNPFFLIFSGISFGLGLSSKWYVIFTLFTTLVFLLFALLTGKDKQANGTASSVVFVCSALILLPFAVYLLSYFPWFERGYDFPDWLSLQKLMYLKTKIHSGYNPYTNELDHKAFLWFIKPVVYADAIHSPGKPMIILGITNPAVWLLTIPSMFYLAYRSAKGRIAECFFILLLFFISYAPLLLSARPIWAHTAFSVAPFAFMVVSYTIRNVLQDLKSGNVLFLIYLVIVIMINIPLYALAIGKGLEHDQLRPIVEMYKPSYDWKK